jgi:hypothetical protein
MAAHRFVNGPFCPAMTSMAQICEISCHSWPWRLTSGL